MRHLLPAIYLMIEPLPSLCLPARVVRHDGMTLVWADPSALRVELAFWTRDNLTDSERTALRMAYDMEDDLAVPPDDRFLDGYLSDLDIPTPLRLPVLAQQLASSESA